jgi:hypothetical protein
VRGIATNKLISAVASKLTKPAAFNEIQPGQGKGVFASAPEQVAAWRWSEDERAIERCRLGADLPRRRDAVGNAGTAPWEIRPQAFASSLTALMNVR